jgi:nicotinamidase/pyrazinamidase
MSKDTAVIMVDLQGDFTETKQGSLAVAGADQAYLDKVASATEQYSDMGLPIYATQDWHPENHCSFAMNHEGAELFSLIKIEGRDQVMWPAHCVQGQDGAALLLPENTFTAVVRKGSDPRYDSYSGFADDGGARTGLEKILKKDGIKDLIIYGLATDFCVKFTVLDAIKAGFQVTLRLDLCRGVAPETTQSAIDEMRRAGAKITG